MTLSLFIFIPNRQDLFQIVVARYLLSQMTTAHFWWGLPHCAILYFFLDIRMTQYSCANNQVGTDEGMVYLCTTQYSSKYLNTYPVSRTQQPCMYLPKHTPARNSSVNWRIKLLHDLICIQAHNTPVYNIQWNTFIPNIFITCASGDQITQLMTKVTWGGQNSADLMTTMTVITNRTRKYSINALDDSDDHSNKEIINQCSTPRMDREDLGQRFDKAVVHVWLKLTGKIGFLIRVYLKVSNLKKWIFINPPKMNYNQS